MNILLMYEPSPAHLAALRAAAPGASFRVARDEPDATRAIENADAVLGNRYFLQSAPYARRLRWMQSNSMGVDQILAAGDLVDSIVITNARGVYDDEMADHAVALVLALARGLHLARDDQRAQQWVRRSLHMLSGKRALILGWGGVGRGIARRLAAFGMEVEGVRRHGGSTTLDSMGFTVRGPSTWRDELPGVDLLVLALPLTAETRHIVAAAELAALPAHAYVVNVGRGGTLDEAALLAALQTGRLAGAALDVFEHEPLPPGHPLWSAQNLIVTAHQARSLERPPFRWEPLFVENLRRFAAGEPLLNVVDHAAGY